MKVTETEYETVEREVQRYKCDHCGVVVTEDQINTVGLFAGDADETARLLDDSVKTRHYCESCSGLREAIKVREQRQTLRDRWRGFASGLSFTASKVGYVAMIVWGMWSMWIAGSIHKVGENDQLMLLEATVGLGVSGVGLLVVMALGYLVGYCHD